MSFSEPCIGWKDGGSCFDELTVVDWLLRHELSPVSAAGLMSVASVSRVVSCSGGDGGADT